MIRLRWYHFDDGHRMRIVGTFSCSPVGSKDRIERVCDIIDVEMSICDVYVTIIALRKPIHRKNWREKLKVFNLPICEIDNCGYLIMMNNCGSERKR